MILVESASSGRAKFDAAMGFARLLQLQGHEAYVSGSRLPPEMGRLQKFEAATTTSSDIDEKFTRVLLIGAERLDDVGLSRLKSLGITAGTPFHAIGNFKTEQKRISILSRISDVIGFLPEFVELNTLIQKPWVEGQFGLTLLSTPRLVSNTSKNCRICIYLPDDLLENSEIQHQIGALSYTLGVKLSLVISASKISMMRKQVGGRVALFGYAELFPDTLAGSTDIAVFFGDAVPGERLASFGAQLLGNGGLVIDCTKTGAIVKTGAPAIVGPPSPAGLFILLRESIIPNRRQIIDDVGKSNWRQTSSLSALLEALGLEDNPRSKVSGVRSSTATKNKNGTMLFIPTNGVGLGHAQRCALIADEVSAKQTVRFAAFPSCIPMLSRKGYDCIALLGKSDQHAEPFANDIINYRRLTRNITNLDHVVFDGGYVFDSILRGILESGARATWIRRGLWQPAQVENSPVERENVFSQVIVPTEAFEELNQPITYGPTVKTIGPIVANTLLSPKEIPNARKKVEQKTGIKFDKLVVSMLGGGVAADRTAQLKAICAHLARRPDVLHLVVVWPNSKIAADLFQWPNTRLMRTTNAVDLCVSADFVVSAVGYNSFHEILYHKIPAILIPQMASYMDDQKSRAKSAAERDLCTLIEPDELLLLRRELDLFLDGRRIHEIEGAFKKINLPKRGNKEAAKLLEALR